MNFLWTHYRSCKTLPSSFPHPVVFLHCHNGAVHRFLYSVEREYPYPVEDLWAAWTQAKALESWYHPTILQSVPGLTRSKTHVGGAWATAVDVPMNDFVAYFFGWYSVVEHFKRLEHSMSYTQSREEFDQRDPDAPAHNIVIEFEPRDGGSWVKFSQYGDLPEEMIEATTDGMTSYFDSLGMYLDEQQK